MNSSSSNGNGNTSTSNRRLWLSPEDLSNLTSCNNNNNNNRRRSNKNVRTTKEDDEKKKKKKEEDAALSITSAATTRKRSVDTYETIFNHFSLKPKPKSLILLLSNTMVFVQEFVLTCLLLAGHRAALLEELDYRRRLEQLGSSGSGSSSSSRNPSVSIHSSRLLTSLGLIWLTLIVAVVKNRFANSKRYTIRHRFTDFLLMAILLRFLSAVLKTLTASYSSDTVYVLSTISLFLHLVTCNYDYANGYDDDDDNDNNVEDDENDDDTIIASNIRKKNQERPTFKGGMISLTSAFFATTLLASRLESNAAVYIFICSSVVLFALYPAARHLVAVKSRHVGKWSKSNE